MTGSASSRHAARCRPRAPRADGAPTPDRGCRPRRVEDGRARVDPEDAEVGDRERPAAEGGRLVRPARAVSARRPISSARSIRLSLSASATCGTMRPRSVAAAMPRLT
jgi:hypothetical protein